MFDDTVSELRTNTTQCVQVEKNIENMLLDLHSVKNNHSIWNNPLLLAADTGLLTLSDYKFIFSQYYFYSKNFTRFLAAAMINCDSDYYRAKLVKNLWEESGEKDIEARHAEIYRRFLTNQLNITLDDIEYRDYTKEFVQQYLASCINARAGECAVMLSFGTEAIIARLYTILKNGLLKVGLDEEALLFFNIHIACDDLHTLTLEEMAIAYSHEPGWLEQSKKAIDRILNLRDTFFKKLYHDIQFSKFDSLIEIISSSTIKNSRAYKSSDLVQSIRKLNNRLYHNQDKSAGINFTVDRVPFHADVLDPRVVEIPPQHTNELHHHAHETVFLILDGFGEIFVDGQIISVQPGDVVYVPRWSKHQTRNTGHTNLSFFAVTDYGLTNRIAQNNESVYRLKKQNVEVN